MDSIAAIYFPPIMRKPWLVIYFLALIVIISIALMNLVTACIVTGAMVQCQEDEEQWKAEQGMRVKKLMPIFQDMFNTVDTLDTGSITLAQVEAFARHQPPELRKA